MWIPPSAFFLDGKIENSLPCSISLRFGAYIGKANVQAQLSA